MLVLIVLCLGALCVLSYFWLSLGGWVAAYWGMAAHSAYEKFSWYKYLVVCLFFSRLGFWRGNLFLIAPFPDRCLLALYLFTI